MLLVFAPLVLQAEDNTTTKQMTKTLAWPDGTRYVGGVMEGKRKGKGTIFWQDGTRFVGQFENDMRNGPGTMILPEGTVYTGFFKDDELVDTERTIAASAKVAAELDNEASAAALQGTELPVEADSLVDKPPAILTQVDENDLLEPVSEPEPTIVLDEAPEPEEKIVAAAKTTPESIAEPEPGPEPSQEENYYSSDVTDMNRSREQCGWLHPQHGLIKMFLSTSPTIPKISQSPAGRADETGKRSEEQESSVPVILT